MGILTLYWASRHYIDTIREITEAIESLKTKGVMTVIAWTPGHANIQGNEEADILAKNAAEEAKHLAPDTCQKITSILYKI